jgi:hypothetical protein
MSPFGRVGPARLRSRIFAGDLSALAFDDLHVVALGEFDSDPAAIARLNAAYEQCRIDYLLTVYMLRAEQAQRGETG